MFRSDKRWRWTRNPPSASHVLAGFRQDKVQQGIKLFSKYKHNEYNNKIVKFGNRKYKEKIQNRQQF